MVKRFLSTRTVLLSLPLLLAACSQTAGFRSLSEASDVGVETVSSTGKRYSEYDFLTILPKDAISAIDNPKFITAEEANESYKDDELVLGVEFNGEARAYSIPLLSTHEIVNDTVGGVKIAVTW